MSAVWVFLPVLGAALLHARYSGTRLAERLTALYLSLADTSPRPAS